MQLADFGAEVVKVEQPRRGDPLRQWTTEGEPFWWQVYARNKRFITLNLKTPEGRRAAREDAAALRRVDGVVRPGHARAARSRLGRAARLEPEADSRPHLGLGADGPASRRPGFGTLVEAASGFAAMNGEPDGAPIVPAFPLADMTSALYAVNAVMFALYHRDVHDGGGQVVDVSLFESLFSLLGPLAAEYAALGRLRERNGSRSQERRSARLLPHRRRHVHRGQRLDAEDGRAVPRAPTASATCWTIRASPPTRRASSTPASSTRWSPAPSPPRTLAENLRIIDANELTAVAVQTVADIERDPHWQARQLLLDVPNGAGAVRMHNVVPRLSETPGDIR